MTSVIIPAARPAIGSAGKTGLWRLRRPVINYDKCRRCMLCWMYCPEAAIEVREGVLIVDYDYCKGCGICASECPAGAISMVKEEVSGK